MIVSPLHTAGLGKSTLRFFRSPNVGADFPFHCHDDLVACLGLPRELRRFFKRKIAADWKADIRTIATPDGIVTIAPHFMAQGLIGAAIDTRSAPSSFDEDYAKAAADALKIVTTGWSADETVAYLIEAFNRQGGGA